MTVDVGNLNCTSSESPNKSSGDIVERTHAPTNDADLLMWCTACPTESAAEIERLRREVENIREMWLSSHLDRMRWRDRALTAESAVAGAEKSLDQAKALMKDAVTDYYVASGLLVIDGQHGYGSLKAMREFLGMEADSFRASAIRAAVSKKTAESGDSPSTHNSESE